ncbi:MAG: MFS transporter [Planctomycetota bacterium]|nr:MFS transporter [Planctomycetota bacterium]
MKPWQRTYWVVYAANLITAAGMMSFLPFFPTFLRELGLTERAEIAAWTGLVFGAAPFAAAIMGPIWGAIGDRFSRKWMVLRALVAITLFVGAMSLVRSPLQLLVLRLGQGVFSGFVAPSITLVSVAAPREVQGRIAGGLQTALAAGSIGGPLLGAFVHETFGIRNVFLVVAAASGLSALLLLFLAREEPGLTETMEEWSPTSVLVGVRRDLRDLFANRGLRSALFVLFVVQFGVGMTNPLLELYVRELWAGDPALVPRLTGILFSVFAVASVVAMPLWGRLGDRIGHGRALVRSAFGGALVLGLNAAAPTYGLLVGARVLLGAATSGASATAFGVAATSTAVERRGGALGAAFSARALAMSVGALAGGALAALLGIRGLFALGALLVALGLALARPARR